MLAIASCGFVILFILYTVLVTQINLAYLPIQNSIKTHYLGAQAVAYDKNDLMFKNFSNPGGIWVPIEEIPERIVDAFRAVEDCDFYKHKGVSITGAIRALVSNVSSFQIVEGGSTISQQLARMLFLEKNRTISRKIKELFLAVRLETQFSKNEIMEAYLNIVFLGNHSYGVHAAASHYFGKSLNDLTIGEAALLAGLPKAPSVLAPHKSKSRSLRRQRHVLDRMVACNIISQELAQAEQAREIEILPSIHSHKVPSQMYFEQNLTMDLQQKFGARPIESIRSGIRVNTNFDPALSRHLDKIFDKVSGNFDKNNQELSLAYVAIRPSDLSVLSNRGGIDFFTNQYDRSRNLYDSALNLAWPIYWAAAFDKIGNFSFIKHRLPSVYLENQKVFDPSGIKAILGKPFLQKIQTHYQLNSSLSNLGTFTGSPFSLASTYAMLLSDRSNCQPLFVTSVIEQKSRKALFQGGCKQSGLISTPAMHATMLLIEANGNNSKPTAVPHISLTARDDQSLWTLILSQNIVFASWVGGSAMGLPPRVASKNIGDEVLKILTQLDYLKPAAKDSVVEQIGFRFDEKHSILRPIIEGGTTKISRSNHVSPTQPIY